MRLAVLGGSHGGFTTAADLALAGHRVRLWARSKEALGPLLDEPMLMLFAEGRQGSARLDRATTDLAEAVEGAEVLIAPLPATSHDELAKRLAPHVNERQIVLLTPGTLGSIFKQAVSRDEVAMKRYAIVVEKATSNYAAYVPDLPGCVATGASVEQTER